MSLKNKRALVTGGSRGIGAAIVTRLAREGCHVALTYVSKPRTPTIRSRSQESSASKQSPLKRIALPPTPVVAAVDRTVKEFGGIDILVNNAGIGVFAPVEQIGLADFDRTFAINVRAVFVPHRPQ